MAGDVTEEPIEYRIQHIRDALAADPRVGELGIEIKVAGGRAHLMGIVPTDERRSAIEQVVASVAPDLEVSYELTVETLDAPGEMERLP